MNIKPIRNYVVVQLVKPPAGLLVLPDQVDGISSTLKIIKVIAVGEGKTTSSGASVPIPVEVGDEIAIMADAQFSQPNRALYPGLPEDTFLLNADAIIAVIEGRGEYVAPAIKRVGVN